jgi:hypothetical protein
MNDTLTPLVTRFQPFTGLLRAALASLLFSLSWSEIPFLSSKMVVSSWWQILTLFVNAKWMETEQADTDELDAAVSPGLE